MRFVTDLFKGVPGMEKLLFEGVTFGGLSRFRWDSGVDGFWILVRTSQSIARRSGLGCLLPGRELTSRGGSWARRAGRLHHVRAGRWGDFTACRASAGAHHPRAAERARHREPSHRLRDRSWSSEHRPPRHLLIGAVPRTPRLGPRACRGPRLRRRRAPQPPLRRGHVGHTSFFQWRRPRDRDRQGDRPATPRHQGPPGQRARSPRHPPLPGDPDHLSGPRAA